MTRTPYRQAIQDCMWYSIRATEEDIRKGNRLTIEELACVISMKFHQAKAKVIKDIKEAIGE